MLTGLLSFFVRVVYFTLIIVDFLGRIEPLEELYEFVEALAK